MDSVFAMPATISDVPTPCFLIDVDCVKNNAARMQDTCQRLKLDLRPHTKTHKTLEGCDILTGGKRQKIATSTLAESEFYADNGYDDILFAYPITSDKADRCVKLTNRLKEFHVLLSSLDGLQCLRDAASSLTVGKVWSVFIELDLGYGRTGLPWDSEDVLKAGRVLWEEPCFHLQGLYTHCGQAYNKTPPERIIDQRNMVASLQQVASKLREAGIKVPVVGTGSTPNCSTADESLSDLDEFHPGNYIFYDYEQVLLGSCTINNVAACVATRVVCQRRDLSMLVIDLGFLGLSHDGMRQRPDDFCVIKDHPHLRLTAMSQELGKIKAKDGESIDFDQYPVGKILFIYPYHTCATAAMYPHFYVHCGDKITNIWKPVKGW